MAEGSKFSKSVLHASEEIHDYNCSPCLDEGIYNEASKYCVSCQLYYCKKCLGHHNKFPALKAHRMQDVASMKKNLPPPADTKQAAAPLTEPCEFHPDELIKMYCSTHEVVCCTVCIALNHRECEGVDYIPKIAQDVRTSDAFKKYVGNMEQLKENYTETKEEIQEEIRKVSNIKDDIMKDIKEFRKEIIDKLDELESKSIVQVNERYKQLNERMDLTVSKVEQFLGKIRVTLQELDNKSEADVFVCMKAESQNESIKDEIDREINEFEGFSFSLDNRIQNVLDESDGLVKLDTPRNVVMKSKHDVTFQDDTDASCITDMCILNDGSLVMIDIDNNAVKRFSEHFDIIGKLDTDTRPFGICQSSSYDQFIITLLDLQMAQFVKYTDERMDMKRSFWVGAPCRGMCLIDEKLFICCGGGTYQSVPGHIRTFDLSGRLLCTIETDDSGIRLFAHPRFLTISLDKTEIYVTDGVNGATVLDKSGKKVGLYKHVNIKGAYSVLCSKYGNFVSGLRSNTIQQFDNNNRFTGTVLDKSDGLNKPGIMCFVESKDQLLLVTKNGDENRDEVLLLQIK